jgi:hypothetical protein
MDKEGRNMILGRASLVVFALSIAALPGAAGAGASVDRATGGGQILFSTRGAGNTIAFTARGTSQDASGQVQFLDRSAGNGQDQERFHGTVTCIDAMGNAAKIAGVLTNGEPFNLFVEDNGEGATADADVIFFDTMAESPDCDFDEPDSDDLEALARGNAQVYDAGD